MSQATSHLYTEAGESQSPTDILDSHGDTAEHGFKLSQPKNYLGVPLAVAAPGSTGGLVMQHLVGMAGEAKLGAAALGLLTDDGALTERGKKVTDEATAIHGSPSAGLSALHDLKGSSGRFIDSLPGWTATLQSTFVGYPPVRAILNVVPPGSDPIALPALVGRLSASSPETAAEHLLRAEAIDTADPVGDAAAAHKSGKDVATACPWTTLPSSFQSSTTFQLKSLLYHAGIVTEPGADSSRLSPTKDYWAHSPRLDDRIQTRLGLSEGDLK